MSLSSLSCLGGGSKIVYRHRESPPLDVQMRGEHVVEATSGRVSGRPPQRDELWSQRYEELMVIVRTRLEQEIVRFGGDYAQVFSESADSKREAVIGQA
jgi:hypothetical protein